jgi:hypothetical protein
MNSSQKCDLIISKLKNERVIVFEGGLQPEVFGVQNFKSETHSMPRNF